VASTPSKRASQAAPRPDPKLFFHFNTTSCAGNPNSPDHSHRLQDTLALPKRYQHLINLLKMQGRTEGCEEAQRGRYQRVTN
jgi:hypothetical protein